MAHGGEDDICGVAVLAFEMAAAEVAIALHVSDDGFDRRATSQFALDNAEDAALLTRDEDAMRVGRRALQGSSAGNRSRRVRFVDNAKMVSQL
jgi:hypothetical protein